jgi:hypothetical protein
MGRSTQCSLNSRPCLLIVVGDRLWMVRVDARGVPSTNPVVGLDIIGRD